MARADETAGGDERERREAVQAGRFSNTHIYDIGAMSILNT
jgi:hypothetical protein